MLSAMLMVGCSKQRGNESSASNDSNTNANATANTPNTTEPAANAPTTAKNPSDFMQDAAKGGIAEVQMGQLAMKNGGPDVKKYGQMLVTDHKKANTELAAIAKKKGVVIEAKDVKNKDASEDEQDMAKLKGADFDKEFIEHAVKDHEKDVDEFQKQADKSDDPDIKAFAAKTLPTLQKHLDQAKSIQAKLNGSASNDMNNNNGTANNSASESKGSAHKH
jgi:putative membrane protein